MESANFMRSAVITGAAAGIGRAIVDELLPSLHAREQNVISAALSVKEQRELRRLIAKLQQSALQARDAPSPRGAVRHRRWTRTAVDTPASNPSSP